MTQLKLSNSTEIEHETKLLEKIASTTFFVYACNFHVCLILTLRPVQTYERNMSAEHIAHNMLRSSVCTPCCAMLLDVGICYVQFETSQTFCPTYANRTFRHSEISNPDAPAVLIIIQATLSNIL